MQFGFMDVEMSNRPVMGGLCEYQLVAFPDKPVQEKLMEEKSYFSTHYHDSENTPFQPFIPVIDFQAAEGMENTLIRWMHKIISIQQVFGVTLNNFSGIKPHTLYLRVKDHLPFQQLGTALQVIEPFLKNNGCPGKYTIARPHLDIARHLKPETYQQAVEIYAHRNFTASFMVYELILMRRQNLFATYKQVTVFRLSPIN